ncbi:hypothetical protein YIM73052_05160 [Thermus antranikianii]
MVGEDPPLGQGGDAGVQVDPLGAEGFHAEGGEAGPQGNGQEKDGREKKAAKPVHGTYFTREF